MCSQYYLKFLLKLLSYDMRERHIAALNLREKSGSGCCLPSQYHMCSTISIWRIHNG